MMYPDCPSPEQCSRCPLRLPLPDDLHDADLAHLVESLYLIAAAIENRSYGQLRRYYAAQRDDHQPHQPAAPQTHHQDLSDDHLPF